MNAWLYWKHWKNRYDLEEFLSPCTNFWWYPCDRTECPGGYLFRSYMQFGGLVEMENLQYSPAQLRGTLQITLVRVFTQSAQAGWRKLFKINLHFLRQRKIVLIVPRSILLDSINKSSLTFRVTTGIIVKTLTSSVSGKILKHEFCPKKLSSHVSLS